MMDPVVAEAVGQRQFVGSFRVRRWTAFEWSGELRDKEQHLELMARLVERRLIDKYPQESPRCAAVRVEGVPQLMFEVTVRAVSKEDACRRAGWKFARVLQAKVPTGHGKSSKVRLVPPWGKVEVEAA